MMFSSKQSITMNRSRRIHVLFCALISICLCVLVVPAFAGEEAWRGVTFLPSQSTPLAAIRLVFAVGSQDDPPGKEGLAALVAAIVSEGGTKSLAYEEILDKFYPMAASVEGKCRKEVTTFAGVVHRDNLADYESILTEMIVSPRFAEADFPRLRDQAIDYVSKTLRGNDDEELGKKTLDSLIYRDHPYGHVDRGTVSGLKAITLDDVKAFHKKYYTKGNLHIGLAGGANQAVLDRIKSDLKSLPTDKTTPPALPRPRVPSGIEATIVEKQADSTAISLGFAIDVTRKDDDFYPLAVANSFLGEHRTFNGKLMKDLRGKRGLNYGDYSYIEAFTQDGQTVFADPGDPRRMQYFSIWIRPVPRDKAGFALRAALWEYRRLIEHGMTEAEFERSRDFLLNYSKLWTQTLPRRLGYVIDGSFYRTLDEPAEFARRLPKTTVREVNEAIKKHLKSDGFFVAIVAKDAAEVKKILESGVPTPLVYDTAGTPQDVLAEDKIIETLPLGAVKAIVVPASKMFE